MVLMENLLASSAQVVISTFLKVILIESFLYLRNSAKIGCSLNKNYICSAKRIEKMFLNFNLDLAFPKEAPE
jgi:hypothetical protein